MRSIVTKLALFLTIFSSQAFADTPTLNTPTLLPKEPSVAASAYLLLDFNSNAVIAEKNSELQVEPASLTKMMTMYIVDSELKNGKIKLDTEVLISKNAWHAPGSRMFLNVDTKVKVEDLIKGVIIQSGNDASVALAEHIAGSEQSFADLMNSYANMLGMKSSHFMNATGLPDKEHYTTAKDMGILARAIIKNFPETYKIYAQKEFVYNGIHQINRNQLLWRNPIVDGIKTGHTDSAGYCLVASGKTNNMRLISIVMGTKSEKARTEEANKLLTWGFRFYETNLIQQARVSLQDTRIWMGTQKRLNVGFAEDLYMTTPQGTFKKYSTIINMPSMIKAPLKQGDIVGTYIVVDQNNQTIFEQPIVALTTVAKGNVLQRGRDYVKLSIRSLIARFKS
jgi:D-alanyl-D-alanine carboxypeptidase (penicillin-binding protein 5/6)